MCSSDLTMIAVLGNRVAFHSAVGEDNFAQLCLQRLTESGLDASNVKIFPGKQTGLTVILPAGPRRFILCRRDRHGAAKAADMLWPRLEIRIRLWPEFAASRGPNDPKRDAPRLLADQLADRSPTVLGDKRSAANPVPGGPPRRDQKNDPVVF